MAGAARSELEWKRYGYHLNPGAKSCGRNEFLAPIYAESEVSVTRQSLFGDDSIASDLLDCAIGDYHDDREFEL